MLCILLTADAWSVAKTQFKGGGPTEGSGADAPPAPASSGKVEQHSPDGNGGASATASSASAAPSLAQAGQTAPGIATHAAVSTSPRSTSASSAAPAGQNGSAAPSYGLWSLIHELLTQRRSLLLLILLTIVVVVQLSYFLFASVFRVEYAGESGVLFRLPGQTVYYFPIVPTDGWHQTNIRLRKDERFSVELSGRVSPGYLQSIDRLQDHLRNIDKWERDGRPPNKRPDFIAPDPWPFTGPEGYDPKWYSGRSMLPVFANHHKTEYRDAKQGSEGYKCDLGLTVMGLPHNTVVGIILEEPAEPRSSSQLENKENATPGYDYNKEKDHEDLIVLSSKSYPLHKTAKRPGALWVVINDADGVRWDNSGMFFMKVTLYTWPLTAP